MKRLVPIILLGFGVALAIVIGQRMSTDAMAVVIGVAVGVAASVPTSLLLVALLRKERATYHPDMGREQLYPPPMSQQPQANVIVLDPAQFAQTRMNNGYPLPPPETGEGHNAYAPDGGQRRLRVVGRGDDWGD